MDTTQGRLHFLLNLMACDNASKTSSCSSGEANAERNTSPIVISSTGDDSSRDSSQPDSLDAVDMGDMPPSGTLKRHKITSVIVTLAFPYAFSYLDVSSHLQILRVTPSLKKRLTLCRDQFLKKLSRKDLTTRLPQLSRKLEVRKRKGGLIAQQKAKH